MPAGDVRISSVKIGDMELTNFQTATFAGFNVYEDILNPYGPVAEIRVVDHSDQLGKQNINGAYDKNVEIKLSADRGGQASYKFKMFQNKNLNDQSVNNTGSGHHKQYDIRCVSEECLNAQGNFIQKSFKGKTSEVVKHILEKGFKTKKKIEMGETKGNRRLNINNKHPLKALHDVSTEHVSQKYKSSCFVTFQQGSQGGEHKYVFKTFEELFEQSPKVKLKQTTQLDYSGSDSDKQNSILWFKPSDSFFTGTRSLSKPSEHAVDLTTHKVIATTPQGEGDNFKYADSQPVYKGSPSSTKQVPMHYIHDKANNKDKHTTAEAKTKRASYLSHLAQNSAELEVYFNPSITLGSMIEVEIPQKSDKSEGGEKQFNGKCLVVAIRTKYRVSAEPPNCTMILRVVKASYKQSSGGQA